MSYKYSRPTQFVLMKGNHKVKLKLSENTFTALGKYLLNQFLKNNNLSTNEDGMYRLVQQVQHFRQPMYTPEEAIEAVSPFVLEQFTVYKKFGKLPMSNRDIRHLSYVIKRTLEVALDEQLQ